MKILRLSLVILGAGAAFAGSALAISVNVGTSADTFVTSGSADVNAGSPTLNYGAAGALEIAAPGLQEGELQTLLQFNFSTAVTTFNTDFGAGNWTVDSITLQLGTNFGTAGQQPNNALFNKINGGLFKIDLLANNNWAEGTGTPAVPVTPSNPPVNGATFDSLSSIETPGSDVTLTNTSTLANTFTYTPVGNTNPPTIPAATYGIGLNANLTTDISTGGLASFRLYAGDTSVSYLFNSKEFDTATDRPELIVDAVPEPATAGLLLAGAGLGLLRRRRPVRTA